MTIVNHETGEIMDAEFDEDLSAEDARTLTDQIRQTLRVGHDLIIRAFQGRAWTALGYSTWDAYCAGEFNEARMVRLDREQRKEIVADMRVAGMSTGAIASSLGISDETARTDALSASKFLEGPKNYEVQGADGKSYTYPRRNSPDPTPAPRVPQRATRRAPLTDFAFDASTDLLKVAERLVRVIEDDRFRDNRAAIASRAAGQINRAMELLGATQTAINSETAP